MNKTIGSVLITLGLGLFLLPSAWAQTAVFKDNVLTIDDGIVIENGEAQYFRDIELEYGADGSFRIAAAQPGHLAPVDELTVAIIETQPVQVEIYVAGNLPNPCVELEEARINLVDNTFYVTIAERYLQTLVACVQVIEPWEKTMPLDVTGLPAGDYLVVVNGTEIDFTL